MHLLQFLTDALLFELLKNLTQLYGETQDETIRTQIQQERLAIQKSLIQRVGFEDVKAFRACYVESQRPAERLLLSIE